MSDLIERQVAIDALRREYNTDDSDCPTEYQLGLSAGRRIIDALPSAQFIEPERKTGKWIRRPHDGIYCTACGKGWSFMLGAPGDIENYHYCPNCGATMEETE